MSTIVTRSGKGSPLTHNEVDTNFTNLNTDKVEKTAADITGGTINNTTIGATTPSTGVFTTLTATGQTSLGGVAGAESLIVNAIAGSTRWIEIAGSVSGNTSIRTRGAGNPSFQFVNRGTGPITFSTADSLSNEQFRVSNTASAVNYVQVTGAATTAIPTISAQGSDGNPSLGFTAKGTGSLIFFTNSSAQRQFRVSHTASAVNYLDATGSATTQAPVLSVVGTDTNIPLVLQPKGTGALQAQQTDSTATGGNARGANAVDWQTSRNAASQVASGSYSVVSGGTGNTSSAFFSTVAGGAGNNISTNYSFIGSGSNNTASSGVDSYSAIVGGYSNVVAGRFNFVGGGYSNSGTASASVTTQSGTMNATTAVTLSGSNANIKVGQLVTGTSINSFPNTYVAAISGTSLTLSQAASGSSTSTLSFFTPHGVVVGGGNNQATGSYSFIGGGGDAGTAANRNVASGDYAVVVGGRTNTASGIASFVGGGGFDGTSVLGNTASNNFSSVVGGAGNAASGFGSFVGGGAFNSASATYSSALCGNSNAASGQGSAVLSGYSGTARAITGNTVFAASQNPISSTQGGSQSALLVLGVQTTDATATVLRSNTSAASTTNQVIMPNNSAYFFTGEVVAGVTGGGNTKGWKIEGVIKRGANAASTALVGTPTVTSTYADAGASTWVIAVTADTTNGGLAITFTGQASTTIRTVAKISTVEMTF